MDRTTLLAFAMMLIIVLGLVADRGVKAECKVSSGKRRIMDVCKRNKMKKAFAKFVKELSDVQTRR